MLRQCAGLHSNKDTDDDGPINPYRNKNLFDGTNYQALLHRLNNGFHVTKTIIQLMKNCVSEQEAEAKRRIKYSEQCISKLNELSPLSFYGTTASVLKRTYKNFEEQAPVIRNSCHLTRLAINRCEQQLDGMYPRQRFRLTRKHRLADEIERQFISADESLKRALAKLPKSLIDNGNTLQTTERNIAAIEEQRRAAITAYNTEVIRIFEECQQLERERLDALKTAVLDFIKAIHPSNYVNPLVQQFQELESHITHEINSTQDVNDWANILGIKIPILSETNQNNDPTTVGNQAN